MESKYEFLYEFGIAFFVKAWIKMLGDLNMSRNLQNIELIISKELFLVCLVNVRKEIKYILYLMCI